MGKSLYKDTLSLLKKASKIAPEGNHLRRLQVLTGMICSCMRTRSSSLEGISTCPSSSSKDVESNIRQSKRWLSSKWTDWDSFFAPFAERMLASLAKKGELVLVVDGSTTAGGCITLMLSVIWGEYAIPVAWITKKGKKGHFKESVHLDLVRCAKKVLPDGCRVVLLGDGEFDGLELRELCKEFHWEFVLRTSTDRQVDCGGENIGSLGSIPRLQDNESVFLESACDGDNAVFWLADGFKDPILLLTNMDLGEMACEYYRKRFKIETLFKQLKSAGFNLHKSKIKNPERVRNLIIVVAFAFIFTFCIGVILKADPPKNTGKFARKDRLKSMSPITLAQKCIKKAKKTAKIIFSDFSKNWEPLFSQNKVYG